MPKYNYLCPACGEYEDSHPMSEVGQERKCKSCSQIVTRIFSVDNVYIFGAHMTLGSWAEKNTKNKSKDELDFAEKEAKIRHKKARKKLIEKIGADKLADGFK